MKALIPLVVSVFLVVKGSEESDDFDQVSSAESSSPDESEPLARERRSVLYAGTVLWPKNETIYYGYDEKTASEFTAEKRTGITERLAEISAATCLKIEEKASGAQVLFLRYPECLVPLPVGWPGRNKTKTIHLESSCDYRSIQHEFFHLLGLGHTVERGDRDLYVTVGNSKAKGQFKKVNASEELILTPPVGYDFKSIMHYGAWDYGIDGAIVIRLLEPEYIATMGYRINPVFSDYKQLNMLYKCGDHCPDYATLLCENGGYHHPKECGKCVCHDFAYGNRCEKLKIKKMTEDYSEHIQPLAFMVCDRVARLVSGSPTNLALETSNSEREWKSLLKIESAITYFWKFTGIPMPNFLFTISLICHGKYQIPCGSVR